MACAGAYSHRPHRNNTNSLRSKERSPSAGADLPHLVFEKVDQSTKKKTEGGNDSEFFGAEAEEIVHAGELLGVEEGELIGQGVEV